MPKPKLTHQQTLDLPPVWRVAGRYGYYMIDEHREGDTGEGSYGSIGPFPSKKLATEVCNAINAAYKRGVKAGA